MPSKGGGSDTAEEVDMGYTGMVSCNLVECVSKEWIIDSGASDHITETYNVLVNLVESENNPQINLPARQTSTITNCGDVNLENKLKLEKVLYVPTFRHNSRHKLESEVLTRYCISQDNNT